jgi:hypothetical protein
MQVDKLLRFFSTSPSVRLLRSPHAPWILPFFYQQFKQPDMGQITRSHSDLIVALSQFLEQLDQYPEVQLLADSPRDKAETYLAVWCSVSCGWLKRFIDERFDEPSYQLTPDSERALAFVQQATRARQISGTQSRLRSIFSLLDTVAAGVAQSPEARIEQLHRQREEIDCELRRLETEPHSQRLPDAQIREHVSLAAQQLEQLKSEFRSVEENFKSITRQVQQKILTAEETRGGILQFAMDSEDLLRQGEHGQSFFEFLKLIHAPDSQDRISSLVQRLSAGDAVAVQAEDLAELRSMIPTLVAEAEKILRTTQNLSSTLRKLLDARANQHHQRLTQLIRDILASAGQLAASQPVELGLDLEVEIDIQGVMERPFWSRSEPFEAIDYQPLVADPVVHARAIAQLVALEHIDWQGLRQNINRMTRSQGAVELPLLLQHYPLQAGAIELLAYLQIAHDDGHVINPDILDEINIESASPGEAGLPLSRRALQLPKVIFLAARPAREPQESVYAASGLANSKVK